MATPDEKDKVTAWDENGKPVQQTSAAAWDEKGNPLPVSVEPKDEGALGELSKATGLRPPPKMFSGPWWKEKGINLGLDVADALPGAGATMGAIGGGMASGGIGAVGGAGIGGMGGAAGRQLMYRGLGWPAPKTTDEAAKDIMKGGIVQSAIQVPSELMPMMAGPLNKMATTQYERALSPTTKVNKAITQKIAPEMMDRGEFGSLEGMAKRAGEKAKMLTPKLDTAMGAIPEAGTMGSGGQIIKDLEALKGKYTVEGQAANPTAVNAISGVQDIVKQYGGDINPKSLRQLKQIFDEPVAAKGGYAGGDLTTAYTLKAQKAAANSIRSILGQASPEVAALNKEIKFWLDVQRVTSQSGLRRTGQEGGLVRALALPLMAGGGAIMGGAKGAAVGFVTNMATRIVRTPAWRTASAVAKDRLADALARGDVGQLTALAARFGVAASSDRPNSQSQAQSNQMQPPQ